MDIILLERVEKLGQMGDVVSVKPGYARNYLLAQGKALRANKANKIRFETEKVHLEANNLAKKEEAQSVADKMNGTQVIMIRAASDAGHLYGSVNTRDIADAIIESGFTINRTQVIMDHPIKAIGFFNYRIRLHPEVSATVVINVAQSQEEAKAQSARVAHGEDAVLTANQQERREDESVAKAQAASLAAAAAAAAEEAEDMVNIQDEEPQDS